MSEHALLAPSSAHIWGRPGGCRAFVSMSQAYPEVGESEAAREGTAAHEVAELFAAAESRALRPSVPDFAANGEAITDDMLEGAKLYGDDVSVVMVATSNYSPNLEHKLKPVAAAIHAENWGTPDAWLYDERAGVLYIWDYKFGRKIVEADENYQGINYAALILAELGINGAQDQHLTVDIRIVQPRAYHPDGPVRSWRVQASELLPYFNHLRVGAGESLSENPIARSGAHCLHCSARHVCETAQRAAYNAIDVEAVSMSAELAGAALSAELATLERASDAIKARLSGIEAQVEATIRSGGVVPGWSLRNKTGRLKWTRPDSEVFALGDLYGVDLRKVSTVTPTQARKLAIDEAVINAYSAKPNTGVKLEKSNPERVFKK